MPTPAGHPFSDYVAPLFDYCYGLLHHPVLAADAVQQALISAEPESGPRPEPGSLRPALYRLARRECEERQPHPAAPEDDEWGADPVHPVTEDDTDVISLADLAAETRERDLVRLAESALTQLPARDREILSLTFRHDISRKDLAAILGSPPWPTRVALGAAIGRFEKALAVTAAVAPPARPGCAGLDKLLWGWDPAWSELTGRDRSRVARHLHSCWRCAESLDDLALGAEWLSVIPMRYLSPALLSRIDSAFDPATGAYQAAAAGRIWTAPAPVAALPARVGRPRAVVVVSAAAAIALAAGVTLYEVRQPHAGPDLAAASLAGGAPRLAGPALRQPSGARRSTAGSFEPVIAAMYPRSAGTPPILVPPSDRHGSAPNPLTVPVSTSPSPTRSPSPSKSPKPSKSPTKSPSPSPSPTTTSPSPSPSPTTTSPSPSPSPSPTTTTPSPSPTTTTPSPSPTSPAPSPS